MTRLTNDLSGIERVIEHDDVAASRNAPPIRQLVDDQPVLIRERRRHALAFDARDLKAERDDQRGVDGGRRQCLDPGDGLVLPDVEAVEDGRRTVVDHQMDVRFGGRLSCNHVQRF